MPVIKCPNGKYRVGSGPCVYKTRNDAERAQRAIKTQKKDANMITPASDILKRRSPLENHTDENGNPNQKS